MVAGELIASALVMGMVSSLHCVGMCGPIALALPLSGKTGSARAGGALLYNLGRVTTYTLMGVLLGVAGELIFPPGLQQALSIAAGVLVLLSILLPLLGRTALFGSWLQRPMLYLRGRLGRLLSVDSSGAFYGIGLLNGLLPCGMVYMALTTSFLTGEVLGGALFMFAFGLGTVPLLFSSVFFSTLMRPKIRLQLRKAAPVFLFFIGTLLILRGLSLGIPYLSPAPIVEGAVCH